jgi:amino acid adenylation domain-containing protein
LPKSPDAVIAVYGIMMAGACYVPIDLAAPVSRAVGIAENVELSAIVTTTDRLGTLVKAIAVARGPIVAFTPTEPPDTLDFDSDARYWYSDKADYCRLPDSDGSWLAYILHTSGSTGLPKGVAISHENSLAFVDTVAEYFAVNSEDRLCSQAPLHFDLSVFDLYVACRQGAAIVLIPEYYSAFPKKMAEAVEKYEITVWNSVVSALTLMMESGKPEQAEMSRVRVVLFSGETMPIKYLRMLRTHMPNAELFNGYGQTEANTSTCYRIDKIPDNDDWRIPIGKPFPGFEVFAMDSAGKLIDEAEVEGELYVRADTVAQGYWNNPQATAERFVRDPRAPDDEAFVYRTGDRVRLDNNGDYLFVGRVDNMIKSRGHRIELGDVDQALLSCPDVAAAAAVAIPDPVIGNRILAFVSAATGCQPDEASILAHCKSQLPAYMLPETVQIRTDLPRTSTGKVDRRLLAESL